MYFNKNYQPEKIAFISFSDIPAAVALQLLWKTPGQKSHPLAHGQNSIWNEVCL